MNILKRETPLSLIILLFLFLFLFLSEMDGNYFFWQFKSFLDLMEECGEETNDF